MIQLGAADATLIELLQAILAGDVDQASRRIARSPDLARASLETGVTRATGEAWLKRFGCYFYDGATPLHAAAMAYRANIARMLVTAGAGVRARDRRGTEPLHLAAMGTPGSASWDPPAQVATIAFLIDAGADPDATDHNGITPLHRAVRTQCAAAVGVLLDRGADPRRKNGSGSTPMLLATRNTGRSGSGSPEAKAEQREIVRVLDAALSAHGR